jgi:DnaJ-domain-containing protein 1
MTDNQLAIIIAGLIAGYWIVAKLFDRVRKPVSARSEQSARAAADAGERRYAPPTPDSVKRPPEHWTNVLGVSQTADLDEIRHAYRLLMTQYHPDKVASLGQELRELAEKKSKQITLAYQDALRARESV